MLNRRVRNFYCLALLLCALVLTACGDDSPPTPAAAAVPTFTPTPFSAAAPALAQPRALSPESKPVVIPPDTPTPAATPDPETQLAQATHLHRYGYYTDEQWLLLGILADAGASDTQHLTARYRLAESYLAEDNFALALDSLDKFQGEAIRLPADDPRRVKAIFLRGESLSGLVRMSEAAVAYQTFLESHPDLTGVVQEIVGDGWQRTGDSSRAASAFRLAADATADRVETVGLLEKLAEALEKGERWAEAADVYAEILSQSVNPSYRASIQSRAGDALVRAGSSVAGTGDENAAIAYWRSVLVEMPDGPAAYDALIALLKRGQSVDLFLQGQISLEAKAYAAARDAYREFLAFTSPDDARIGSAWLGAGRAYAGLDNWTEAQSAFDRVLADFPTCACFGQAWLEKARVEILRGNASGGRRIYRTFAREYPKDPLAPEALWRGALSAIIGGETAAGDFYRDFLQETSSIPQIAEALWRGALSASAPVDLIEAATDILALADGFPASERAADGLYFLGIGAFVNGSYSQSQNAFQRLSNSYPDVWSGASAYWLGRVLYAQGQQEQARQLWLELVENESGTYYGVLAGLAARRVGLDPQEYIFAGLEQAVGPASTLPGDNGSRAFAEQWLSGWVTQTVDGWGVLSPAVAEDVDLRNGKLLLDLGRRGEALSQLGLVYRRYQDDPAILYALALHFEELQTFRLSIVSAVSLLDESPAKRMEDAPIFLQRIAYPRHFADLIDAEAGKNGFDPLIFYSLIRQESLFEEGARSFAAAQGLAQIIPATGAEIAGRIGFPNYSNALIYRPYVNLRFGAFYLAWVRDFVDGRIASALAGYNGGPGNSQRWRERAGADDTLFVELMDYSETRLYLQRILSHYYHYTRLYP